jgi:hypothetical protein
MNAPSHKLTIPGGERLPSGIGITMNFLTNSDWWALLDGHHTPWMTKAVAKLRDPIELDARRRRRREPAR